MPYNSLASSTFLDAFGASLYTPAQYATLAGGSLQPLTELLASGSVPATIKPVSPGERMTIGLTLDRVTDVAPLLAGNWAERQAILGGFATPAALWNAYGADQALYDTTVSQVTTVLGGNGALLAAASLGFQSSAANRTIWVDLTPTEFQQLFGQSLSDVGDRLAWSGNLGLDSRITAGSIVGLAIQKSVLVSNPAVAVTQGIDLEEGPLGIGNSDRTRVIANPAAVADNYNFPLPSTVATGGVALIEPEVTTDSAGLLSGYNAYRTALGLPVVSAAQLLSLSANSTATSGELLLDISVVTGGAPNSTQLLYSGKTYQGYQDAFFDAVNQPHVLSSSYTDVWSGTAGSPFLSAFNQLMIDGVLANVSVHRSAGDGGSSAGVGTGGTWQTSDHSSPYMLVVGGTSISPLSSGLEDPTLKAMVKSALEGDPETIFPLVAAGLKTLPSNLSRNVPSPVGAAATLTTMFEATWQALKVVRGTHLSQDVLEVSYGAHETGGGAPAPQVAIPDYQLAYGLTGMTGGYRGAIDVSALSSGNSHYTTINPDYVSGNSTDPLASEGGTSAAAPFWASLTAQFDAIFEDQGLPPLGFHHDLLYTAAVVAPGSFNDIQLGNNITSFYTTTGGPYWNSEIGAFMTPTGQGYHALPGYDLASGLGTPNGTLLARALTAIAHAQVSFSGSPSLLEDDGHGGWQSGARQSVMLQAGGDGGVFDLQIGGHSTVMVSGASSSFAWTSRLAEQVLQPDFDPALVKLFDKRTQGASAFVDLADNASLSVGIDGAGGQATQAGLSNPFGFADFFAGNDMLRVARPVAIAQTVGAASDQVAIVRMRQAGEDSLQLTLYRVDDMTGKIGDKAPGHAGYAEAAQSRAYATSSGGSAIAGPGFGLFAEVQVTNVDAGDLVAMRLDNVTRGQTLWGFANGNEKVGGQSVNHLWNYGLNTWGFEDTLGGGDRDFNDLVVQIDFTSASGHGWLA